MNWLRIFIGLVLSLTLIGPAHAWWDEGHRLVAEIAWQELTPSVRAWVEGIVRSNRDRHFANLVEGATWPDYVKVKRRPETSVWHYINLPLVRDGVAAPEPPPTNLLWALERCRSGVLTGRGAERADWLNFLTHLVGDAHQPLHAACLFSAKFPEGDRGGARIAVGDSNLHVFWDSAAGFLDRNPSSVQRSATAAWLRERHPRAEFRVELARSDFSAWLRESHGLADSRAYADDYSSQAYRARTRAVCQRQLALAGYRCADLLSELYRQRASADGSP